MRRFSISLTMCLGLVCLAAEGAAQASQGPIRVRLDTDNAQQTLRILSGDETSEQEWQDFFALAGTQALLARMERWGQEPTTARMRELLEDASQGVSDVPLRYGDVARDQDALRVLTDRLEDDRSEIERLLNNRLATFLGDADEMILNVVFILGGFSAGFTRGGPDNQFIGLHHYDGDLLGIRNLILHESFHNVQAAFAPNVPDGCLTGGEAHTYDVLYRVFQEGTAEFVADIWDYDPLQAPWIGIMQEHLSINRSAFRQQQTEGLIELLAGEDGHLLGQESGSPWHILFGWNWNNPGYFYGYQMSALLYERGAQALLHEHLRDHPTRFFLDYIEVALSAGAEPFSAAFVNRIRALESRLESCTGDSSTGTPR